MSTTASPAARHLYEQFESTPCTRCSGDAAAFRSYGHVNAGRCLKCDGTTHAPTRRGQAAINYYKDQLEVGADAIEPGMLVRPAKAASGQRITGSKQRVQTVETDADGRITITGSGVTATYLPGTRFTLIPTAERKAEVLAEALAYQATLTKAGTPRVAA